jgi:hypothetical protein
MQNFETLRELLLGEKYPGGKKEEEDEREITPLIVDT